MPQVLGLTPSETISFRLGKSWFQQVVSFVGQGPPGSCPTEASSHAAEMNPPLLVQSAFERNGIHDQVHSYCQKHSISKN